MDIKDLAQMGIEIDPDDPTTARVIDKGDNTHAGLVALAQQQANDLDNLSQSAAVKAWHLGETLRKIKDYPEHKPGGEFYRQWEVFWRERGLKPATRSLAQRLRRLYPTPEGCAGKGLIEAARFGKRLIEEETAESGADTPEPPAPGKANRDGETADRPQPPDTEPSETEETEEPGEEPDDEIGEPGEEPDTIPTPDNLRATRAYELLAECDFDPDLARAELEAAINRAGSRHAA